MAPGFERAGARPESPRLDEIADADVEGAIGQFRRSRAPPRAPGRGCGGSGVQAPTGARFRRSTSELGPPRRHFPFDRLDRVAAGGARARPGRAVHRRRRPPTSARPSPGRSARVGRAPRTSSSVSVDIFEIPSVGLEGREVEAERAAPPVRASRRRPAPCRARRTPESGPPCRMRSRSLGASAATRSCT